MLHKKLIQTTIGMFIKVILTLIILLYRIVFLPCTIIIKTIVTIWQPYFHNRSQKQWIKIHRRFIERGGYADYPPEVGTLFGITPWDYTDKEENKY